MRNNQKFKVGGVLYTAKERDGFLLKHNLMGQACFHDNLIEIDSSMAEDRKDQTLIHELTHAMLYEAGYDAGEQDEDLVNRLSMVLYQVLVDNDFSFLLDNAEEADSEEEKEVQTIYVCSACGDTGEDVDFECDCDREYLLEITDEELSQYFGLDNDEDE